MEKLCKIQEKRTEFFLFLSLLFFFSCVTQTFLFNSCQNHEK